MNTAKQNQKFPFHFLFAWRRGWGERREKNARKFLVFAHASPRACPRRASLVVRVQFKIHSNFRIADRTLVLDFKNAFKIAEKYHAEALCAEANFTISQKVKIGGIHCTKFEPF